MKPIFIIAEAGVNHNGSLETAKKLVDRAKEAGADAVKFQSFRASSMVSQRAAKARYQKKSTSKKESQYGMIKRLELGEEAHRALIRHCRKRKIRFLSSAFDLESMDLLARLGLKTFKVPSGEITNLPYLRKLGKLKKEIILSTGMATLDEIREALNILTQGGTKKEKITVLHCNTEYPTPYGDVNLRAMLSIKNTFHVRVGYSDHTPGIEVPIAAAALGAEAIEKHFTLDRKMEGPDHASSLEPDELKKMVGSIRNIEKSLGDGIKRPSKSERKNIRIVRKSLVARRKIEKGETFSEENVAAKRPGTGLSPMRWDEVMGRKARRTFDPDEAITL